MAAIVKRRPLPAAWQAVNVKDYGATGDGTTSDQVAVALAVSRAYAAGAELYWPPGTYLTTANVPNLHDVRHRGPGIIKRGSTLFYPDPKSSQSNTLYVSTSGSTSNDGITSSEPMTLLRSAAVVLAYAERGLPGRWVVEGAAGTYASGQIFNLDSLTWTDYPITLRGPDVSGHPNTPTMIIDMTGNESGRGVSITEGGWLMVEDVKVIDATTGYGFYVQRAHLTLTNCHTDNCFYGVVGTHEYLVEVLGGDYDGNDISGSTGYFGRYSGSHSIGLDDTPANAALFHHFQYGLRIGEGVTGHLDGTRIHDCTVGSAAAVFFDRTDAGCNTKNMQLYRNDVGVLAINSAWYNNGIDFGTSTDANTVNVRTYNGPEYDYIQDFAVKTPRQVAFLGPQSAHTGTVSKTAAWTLTDVIRSWMISEGVGDYVEIEAYFVCSLATSFCAVTLDLYDGTTTDFQTTVTAPVGTTDFYIKATVLFSSATAQVGTMVMVAAPAGGTDMVDEGTGALAFKNLAGTVILSLTLGNTGDSVTLKWARCISTLGG